ncbi:thioesterase family protein [Botrimarina sp.]|uniref:acyl-CoA thioesterase n=1 Tax=Botrimarina sp. TaxID=2795802 RepID=UPI0032EB8A04
MPAPFAYRRLVQFADTDMAGIVHFSVFFRYMEEAEHALRRHIGMSIHDRFDPADDRSRIAFPRVSARCDYHSPARCEDELRIEVTVQKLGKSSVTYGFHIFRDEAELAVGEMTSVCCCFRDGVKPRPTPLPDAVLAGLKQFAA